MNTLADNKSRLHYLDSLRGLAALYVVFHHLYITCWPLQNATLPAQGIPWLSWLKYGHVSVTFFIVLSGFVITLPLVRCVAASDPADKPQWRRFFRRRATRILPPYFAALVISLLLVVSLDGFKALKWSDVAGHLLLLQDWGVGDDFAINGPMWSVPVEWHIYFTVPLLYLGWKFLGVGLTAVLSLFAAYSVLHFLPHTSVRLAISPQYYGIFAVGAAAAFWVGRRPVPASAPAAPGSFIPPLLAALFCLLVLGLEPWTWYEAHYEHFDLLCSLFAALLIIWLAGGESFVRRILTTAVLVGLGEMSYSLYLIHGPLLVSFDRLASAFHLSAGAKFLFLCGVAVPLILVLTYLFHVRFERPFLVTKNRKAGAAAPILLPATQNLK